MAPKANQTVIDRALSHEPIPGAIIVDRKARKAQAARFQKTRRIKQSFMGTVFLILLAAGWLYPLIGYFIPVCMVLGIGLASFQGRSWCNWVCPRGSFEDAWLAKISRKRPIPQVFRSTRLRVAVMTFLMGMLTWQVLRLWPNPWAIGKFFVLMLSITTAVGVGLGIIFHQRTWKYIRPIGTM
jgi:ferredoxin-type protein NapH